MKPELKPVRFRPLKEFTYHPSLWGGNKLGPGGFASDKVILLRTDRIANPKLAARLDLAPNPRPHPEAGDTAAGYLARADADPSPPLAVAGVQVGRTEATRDGGERFTPLPTPRAILFDPGDCFADRIACDPRLLRLLLALFPGHESHRFSIDSEPRPLLALKKGGITAAVLKPYDLTKEEQGEVDGYDIGEIRREADLPNLHYEPFRLDRAWEPPTDRLGLLRERFAVDRLLANNGQKLRRLVADWGHEWARRARVPRNAEKQTPAKRELWRLIEAEAESVFDAERTRLAHRRLDLCDRLYHAAVADRDADMAPEWRTDPPEFAPVTRPFVGLTVCLLALKANGRVHAVTGPIAELSAGEARVYLAGDGVCARARLDQLSWEFIRLGTPPPADAPAEASPAPEAAHAR